jgi:hypothetical protein
VDPLPRLVASGLQPYNRNAPPARIYRCSMGCTWYEWSTTTAGDSRRSRFILLGKQIWLDLQRWGPANELASLQVEQWPVAELQSGQWHQFVAKIRWDVSEGTVQLWHNGDPVTFDPQVPSDTAGQPQYPPGATTSQANAHRPRAYSELRSMQ